MMQPMDEPTYDGPRWANLTILAEEDGPAMLDALADAAQRRDSAGVERGIVALAGLVDDLRREAAGHPTGL